MINITQRSKTAVWCSSIAAMLFTVSSQGSEYSFDYAVELGGDYNDNVRLTPDNQIDIIGGVLNIPLNLRRRSERLDTTLRGELGFSRYDVDEYDSNDQEIEGRATYQLERGELEGYAGYVRDSTRTAEFLDTGLVGPDASRRELFRTGGTFSHLITERNGILIGADYRDVDQESSELQDYKDLTGNLGVTHQWSQATRLRAQLYGGFYESDDFGRDVESDTVGFQVGYDSEVSENFQSSLLVGWANVSSDFGGGQAGEPTSEDTDSLLLQGSLSYTGERHSLRAEIFSEPDASSGGTLYERHRLNGEYRYQLTERARLRVGVVLGKQSSVDDLVDNDRDFARLALSTDYRVTRHWSVRAVYQFSYQDRESDPGDADQNEVRLLVIYRPDRFIWSR